LKNCANLFGVDPGHAPVFGQKSRPKMTEGSLLQHSNLILRPDPSRTVIRPFMPGYPVGFDHGRSSRTQVIVNRILAFDDALVASELAEITASLNCRHRDLEAIFGRRFDDLASTIDAPDAIDDQRVQLIGAYLSEEYAFEAAALFNPSMVRHPDQNDLSDGAVRFIMSLRGIGEGHVSSVTFRTGTWTPGVTLEIDPLGPFAVAPLIEGGLVDSEAMSANLLCGGSRLVSETVLFPVLRSQKQGIEDVRLVHFTEEDGASIYYGTYTAFNGMDARSEMLSTTDFRSISMRSMSGDASTGKGMALFPRRINGRYAMLGRQDNENIWLLYSDDLQSWNGGEKLLEPRAPWEVVQMGNCGSPIEIEEGWLVITHGVGMVRNYCLGAALLDLDDPSKVLARTIEPILSPTADDRDGYVPNVVYSCGGIVHNRRLLLPYGVADSFTAFATINIDDLLAAMDRVEHR
jgi:predicted GH43/DUF377 family glycosyl hydrolase